MKDMKKENLSKIFSEFKINKMNQYDELYKEYYSTVYGIIFPILKNKENTEDVTQEVFIKIYNMKKENLPEKGELSWLYTVSKNEAFQFLRKNKHEINFDEAYEIKQEKSDIDEIIDVNTYNKIISSLNEIEKQIVSLKILSNFTFKEIGKMLLIPTPTVQWRYYKAVNSLKISIGSFAAFLFTFIIFIGRKNLNIKNSNKLENNETINNDHFDKEDEENTYINIEKSETTNNFTNCDSDIYKKGEETYSTEVADKGICIIENDCFSTILLSFSGFFLMISIIFAIFFKKYQQKKVKKTSK